MPEEDPEELPDELPEEEPEEPPDDDPVALSDAVPESLVPRDDGSIVPPHAVAPSAGAATRARPRSNALAVPVREPSSFRSAAPQKGQWLELERACRLQLGQVKSVSRRYMPGNLSRAAVRVNQRPQAP